MLLYDKVFRIHQEESDQDQRRVKPSHFIVLALNMCATSTLSTVHEFYIAAREDLAKKRMVRKLVPKTKPMYPPISATKLLKSYMS